MRGFPLPLMVGRTASAIATADLPLEPSRDAAGGVVPTTGRAEVPLVVELGVGHPLVDGNDVIADLSAVRTARSNATDPQVAVEDAEAGALPAGGLVPLVV